MRVPAALSIFWVNTCRVVPQFGVGIRLIHRSFSDTEVSAFWLLLSCHEQ